MIGNPSERLFSSSTVENVVNISLRPKTLKLLGTTFKINGTGLQMCLHVNEIINKVIRIHQYTYRSYPLVLYIKKNKKKKQGDTVLINNQILKTTLKEMHVNQ